MKRLKLNNISIVKGEYGGGFSAKEFDSAKPRYIRITDINEEGTLNQNIVSPSGNESEYKKYVLRNGDLLFARSGATVGKTFLYDEKYGDCIYAGYLIRFRINQEIAFSRYIYYFTKSTIYNAWVKSKQNVVAQPNINAQQYGNELEIPLPPLPEQKHIADLLDAADRLRQKDKALLEKYDQLAQSLFLEMFGDPVKNEKGWEVKKLKELSDKIGSGNTPKGGSSVYVDDGIMFFRSQNVWKNKIVTDDIAFIDQDTHKNMRNSSLRHGDILMTKTGRFNTENSSLGRAAMYLGKDNKANVNGHVYLIRLKTGVIREYVLFILTSVQFRDHIRRVCVGGIDKRQLNKEHIEDFPIIQTPIELQIKFAEQVQLIEKQKKLAKENLKKSEELFQGLMGEVFN